MKTFNYAEQKGSLITFISYEGFKDIAWESQVIDYIEKNQFNVQSAGVGLVIDPNAREWDCVLEPKIYLEEKWDEVTKAYWDEYFNGRRKS